MVRRLSDREDDGYLVAEAASGPLLSLVHVDAAADDPFILERIPALITLRAASLLTPLELGTDGGRFFTVARYVEGQGLAAATGRPMDAAHALALFDALCEALAILHGAGLAHGNLTPAALVIDAAGTLCVGGLQRPREKGAASHSGATRYLSPEHIMERPITARSDVFVAGALLYEWLSGCPAFDGPSPAAVTRAVLMQDPEPLDRRVALLKPRWAQVVARALHKEADRRYAGVLEMRRDLHLAGEMAAPTAAPVAVSAAAPRVRTPRESLIARRQQQLAAVLARAESARTAGRDADAARAYEEALVLDPTHPVARAGLARVTPPPPPAPERDAFGRDVFVTAGTRSGAGFGLSLTLHALMAVGIGLTLVAPQGALPALGAARPVFLAKEVPDAPPPSPPKPKPPKPAPPAKQTNEVPPPDAPQVPVLDQLQPLAAIEQPAPPPVDLPPAPPVTNTLALDLLVATARPAPQRPSTAARGTGDGIDQTISEEPVTDFDQNPALVTSVNPQVPAGATGTVRVEVLILTTGRVSRTRVLDSTPYAQLIQEAASQFVFRPARRRGRPVAVVMILTFRLSTIK